MNKWAIALAAALSAAPSAALGHDFSCRNEANEIRCEGGECRVETESFTPVQLSRTGRGVTLCAYSGCWEGQVGFERSRSGVHFLQASLRRTGPADPADPTLLSVMFTPRERTAQISWNGFFSVLGCR